MKLIGNVVKQKSDHLSNASVGEDVAGVDQTVQHLSCLLNQVTLVWVVLQLLVCERQRTDRGREERSGNLI